MAAIIELLLKIQLIDERQHDGVMSRSHGATGGYIVQQIAEMGYATEGTMARAISVEMGLPRIDLAMTPPEEQAFQLLDARTCAERFVLPVALRENGELLWLAMADPTDQESIAIVRRRTGKRVRPAVAGPSEIVRAVRMLYSAPTAGVSKPEAPPNERLAAIEIADQASEEAFEVVGVADEIDQRSALSRIAAQLGVAVPANIASRGRKGHADDIEILEGDPEPAVTTMKARPASPRSVAPSPTIISQTMPKPIPPRPDARPAPRRGDELEQLVPAAPGPITADDLSADDYPSLKALRSSMEKGALVLRAVAELCVDKGIFTREEMRKRNAQR